MRTIAALYVEAGGVYYGLEGVDPWPVTRDARLYDGPHPVIAHPPCERWSMLANVVTAKSNGRIRVGDDGRSFELALAAVEKFGGVLEHPRNSMAFKRFGINAPSMKTNGLWIPTRSGFVCQVAQSAYGHKATKLTWLYASGVERKSLPDMKWEIPRGTHEIGGESRLKGKRPSLARSERSKTPIEFRDLLISIARSCKC